MPSKPWYQSKAVWATLIGTLVSVYAVISGNFPTLHLPSINEGFLATMLSVLSALGLYGRVSATTTISK